ncbi:hypothetical protein BGZ95_006616 [Linnemannia exigua]|uniref:F-box domain-containing protein n=1 Tax=Linnemannia exigua TaxID=604196 RepID=A0AAD4DLB2_9FUNG|nr:hypothetical protein BGZ95_006616 [Linnemannia exigua]
MSIRKLRNSFQRCFQLDRFVLEQDNNQTADSSIAEQGSSSSIMGHDSYQHPHHFVQASPASHIKSTLRSSSSDPLSPINPTTISHNPPCFVSCFSPLNLPPDLLIYFIKFLTPGDLWKLCQVSKRMQPAIAVFMSRSQRFGFEAIRILRQEHSWTDKQLLRVHHEKYYEDMRDHFWITHQQPLRILVPPFPGDEEESEEEEQQQITNEIIINMGAATIDDAPIQSQQQQQQQQHVTAEDAVVQHIPTQTAPTQHTLPSHALLQFVINNNPVAPTSVPPALPAPSRGVVRSQYWVSQANFLFAAILESSEGFQSSLSQDDQEMEDTEAPHSTTTVSTTATANETDTRNDPAMGAFWTNHYETTTKTISSPVAKKAMVDETGHLLSSTKDRFWSIVQLLFDSNLVNLAYRRAIINCARYMTAKFDSCFAYGLRVNGRDILDTDYYGYRPEDYAAHVGPHLALYPDTKLDRESNVPPKQPSDVEDLLTVLPPRRLQSTFQAMLWRRCLHDLVGVYNRIQELHNSPIVIGTTPSATHDIGIKKKGRIDQENLRQRQQEAVEQQRPIGRGFRKMIHRIRSVAKKRPYPNGLNSRDKRASSLYRSFSPSSCPASTTFASTTVPAYRLRDTLTVGCEYQYGDLEHTSFDFEHQGSSQQPRESSSLQEQSHLNEYFRVKKSDTHLFRQRAINLERALLQRRILMEERKRRDTLLKEELLGLCHMACGLFMVKNQRRPEQGGPQSIMTLLRQGSPWKQGVWREGEWRHAPIDLDHDVDETVMAHQYHVERDYKHLRDIVQNRHRWSFSHSFDFSFTSASLSSSASSTSSSSSFSSITSANSSSRNNDNNNDRSDNNNTFDDNELASFSELISILPLNITVKEDDRIDRGSWQSLCFATIKFLMDDRLTWGGNDPNHELSKLKATLHEGAWYYHE